MKLRSIFSITLLALLTLSAMAMTDEEVITYIRTQSANGKSEQQIGKELLAKGVRPDQVKRLKARFNKDQNSNNNSTQTKISSTSRGHSSSSQVPQSQLQSSANILTDATNSTGQSQYEPSYYDYNDISTIDDLDQREVFGHDIFNARALSFEPSKSLATPKNYRLGPGDEVIIDVWGDAEEHLREEISPEGSIMVARLGPVYLNGKTVDEANSYIKNIFAKKYAGVGSAQTDINLTLGEVRSIQIDVMGEVSTPGSFQLSPFSTVFHALYNAGGINNIGSMRNISVLRNGKRVATVDIYDYLFNGRQNGNIRLQEGDVIIVPPYEQIVNISGNVKRPMHYEIKPGETMATLLEYAGGLSGDAYSGMVRLMRQNGEENELYNIDRDQFSTYTLKDGDAVSVGTVLDRYSNRVELKGAVMRPGIYALGTGTTTLGELIRKADGLMEDAYTGRVLLYRQGPDLTLEVIPVDINAVLNDSVADIPLKKNDIIEVASVQELEEKGDFSIDGMVVDPGYYSYMANTSVEDLIVRAGGLKEGASTARVDISRRIVNPTATSETQQIAQTFTVDINNGLNHANKKAKEFILKPYDRVTVRTAPGYAPQQQVAINGEILFPGEYTLVKRNERLSELVLRAGGVVDGAYLKGAYLKRQLSEDERQARESVLRIAMQNQEGRDSISEDKINVSSVYNVGINLPMALAHPGSNYDLVLREGDELYVPQYQNTVKISGDVMYPNTIVYEQGKKVSYYINQAGGYGNRARKNKCFIVYMNGQVAKVGRGTVVEPGSHIIVPSKEKTPGNTWEKVLTFVSGFGSIATMAATITSLFRR